MNRSPFPVLASAALLTLGLAACTPSKEDKPPQPKVTAEATPTAAAPTAALPKLGAAPKWQLTDLNGKPIDSEQLKGKVVVLDFWATWCGPCVMEIPDYIAMQKKYGDKGLVIVGASIDQAGPEVVKEFATKKGINYALAMADEPIVSAFGGIEAIPTTFLIDRQGQIRERKLGLQHDFEQKVAAVVHEPAS